MVLAQLTQLIPPIWSVTFSWITWYPASMMASSMVFWLTTAGLYSTMAFSAARLTVALTTPSSFESCFSMVRAQFMQLMPPTLSAIFRVFSWLILAVNPFLLGLLAFYANINISFKDISSIRPLMRSPQILPQNIGA